VDGASIKVVYEFRSFGISQASIPSDFSGGCGVKEEEEVENASSLEEEKEEASLEEE
jgi:hypothetical protein